MTEPQPETFPEAPPSPAAPERRRAQAILLAALAVIIVVAIVAASPFWAPKLMPLLPWGKAGSAGEGNQGNIETRLSARLDRIEAAVATLTRTTAAANTANQDAMNALGTADKAALAAFDRRVQALENKPPPAPPDLAPLQGQIAGLGGRLDALGKHVDGLSTRVAALEKAIRKPTANPTDIGAALVVLQIDAALRTARPFPDEYAALAALVHGRPDLAAAAAPLAGAAKAGVASRAVLSRRLHALAMRIATAQPPPAADDLGGRIMAQLHSLVTIRRVGGAGETPAETAVDTAEAAMRHDDLAGAVEAMRGLTGANAAAAKPWLDLAEPRLQAEAALNKLTTLLAARLGKPAALPEPG